MKNIIIVVLTTIIVGLLGYILWDKGVFSSKVDNSEIEYYDMKNFPTSSDSKTKRIESMRGILSADELKTNFQNLEKTKEGIKLLFSCTRFVDDETDIVGNEEFLEASCYEYNIKVDDKFEFENYASEDSSKTQLYKSTTSEGKNVYVVFNISIDGTGSIRVYDQYGTLRLLNTCVTNSVNNWSIDNAELIVKEGKLYFLEFDDNNRQDADFRVKSLDLSSYEQSVLGLVKGTVGVWD